MITGKMPRPVHTMRAVERIAWIGVVGVACLGAGQASVETVRARRFELLDNSGKVAAVWQVLTPSGEQRGVPVMQLWDPSVKGSMVEVSCSAISVLEQGRTLAMLYRGEEGRVGVALKDRQGNDRITVEGANDEWGIRLRDGNGRLRAGVGCNAWSEHGQARTTGPNTIVLVNESGESLVYGAEKQGGK